MMKIDQGFNYGNVLSPLPAWYEDFQDSTEQPEKEFQIAGLNGYLVLLMIAGLILIFNWNKQ